MTQKGEMVSRLQVKASQIGKILTNLEKMNTPVKETCPGEFKEGGAPPTKKSLLQCDPIPPYRPKPDNDSTKSQPTSPSNN